MFPSNAIKLPHFLLHDLWGISLNILYYIDDMNLFVFLANEASMHFFRNWHYMAHMTCIYIRLDVVNIHNVQLVDWPKELSSPGDVMRWHGMVEIATNAEQWAGFNGPLRSDVPPRRFRPLAVRQFNRAHCSALTVTSRGLWLSENQSTLVRSPGPSCIAVKPPLTSHTEKLFLHNNNPSCYAVVPFHA